MPDLGEIRMAGGEERATGDDGPAERSAACRDLVRRILVHDHAAQEHIIRPANVGVAERLHVEIHQAQLPTRRQHRRDRQQAERRKRGFLRDEPKHVMKAPEALRAARIDQKNVHAATAPRRATIVAKRLSVHKLACCVLQPRRIPRRMATFDHQILAFAVSQFICGPPRILDTNQRPAA